jgi:hypothetical protein
MRTPLSCPHFLTAGVPPPEVGMLFIVCTEHQSFSQDGLSVIFQHVASQALQSMTGCDTHEI